MDQGCAHNRQSKGAQGGGAAAGCSGRCACSDGSLHRGQCRSGCGGGIPGLRVQPPHQSLRARGSTADSPDRRLVGRRARLPFSHAFQPTTICQYDRTTRELQGCSARLCRALGRYPVSLCLAQHGACQPLPHESIPPVLAPVMSNRFTNSLIVAIPECRKRSLCTYHFWLLR